MIFLLPSSVLSDILFAELCWGHQKKFFKYLRQPCATCSQKIKRYLCCESQGAPSTQTLVLMKEKLSDQGLACRAPVLGQIPHSETLFGTCVLYNTRPDSFGRAVCESRSAVVWGGWMWMCQEVPGFRVCGWATSQSTSWTVKQGARFFGPRAVFPHGT